MDLLLEIKVMTLAVFRQRHFYLFLCHKNLLVSKQDPICFNNTVFNSHGKFPVWACASIWILMKSISFGFCCCFLNFPIFRALCRKNHLSNTSFWVLHLDFNTVILLIWLEFKTHPCDGKPVKSSQVSDWATVPCCGKWMFVELSGLMFTEEVVDLIRC